MLEKMQILTEQISQSPWVQILKFPFFTLGGFELSIWLLIKAVILFFLFVFFARFLNFLLNRHLYPRLKLETGPQYALAAGVKYIVIFIGFVTVVNLLGINLGAFAVFAGTIGIGIGFGLQDVTKNFISGLVILMEQPIKVGDFIEVEGLPGRVSAINARGTVIDTFDNTAVIVPNSQFISNQVINWSHTVKMIRLAVVVGVAYGSDTALVKKLLLEVAAEHPKILKEPEPYVWFTEFGESSLNFKLLAFIREPDRRMTTKSELNFAIDQKFRQHHVTIPFPQRDLHFKTTQIPLGGKA